ncbi:hypothetical protein DID88_005322 [Monilinia fructigena]|uniref:RanBP2-type domain-containing protein n=1 Tax=Monilinia fructigena TaxID=38457 RepID=A0A395IZR2_9HELO|nr:hypothetical protein DID88_005322 [Monilinia fructigena]
MQRAFPLPVNVGTDICQISRINDILTKHQSKYAHRFIRRVFTPQEQVWYRPRLLPLIEYLHFMERREFIQGKIEKQQRWRAKSIEALIGLVEPKESPLLNKTTANHEPVGSLIWSPYTTQGDPKRLTKEEEESMLIHLKQKVQGVARFIAGRFAAKEAAKKAFSKRRLSFHDISIDNPSLDNLKSRAPITLIKSTKGQEDQIVPMSISHDGDYATAVCGGSSTSATVIKSSLNASGASEPVQPASIDDSTIESNLDVARAPNPVHPEVSPSSTNGPNIKYHLSATSAVRSINFDLLNKSFNRNSPGFQPRDYSFDGSQAKGNPPTDFQVKYYPTAGASSSDVPVLQPGDWVCQSEGCGFQNHSEKFRCVNCDTKRLEGWTNYIDPDSDYNKKLAEHANYTGLPFEIDPEKEKEKKARIEVRQERLKTRTQSIYGLPTYIDPKVVKKNVENCLAVDNLPPGTTNEELIEAFKGRCTAIKGYVKVSRVGQIRAWVILSRKTEANKLRHLAKKPHLFACDKGSSVEDDRNG